MSQRSLAQWIGLLLLIGICSYYLYPKNQSSLFEPSIIDKVHTPSIHPLFQAADAAKYAQDYEKADLAFQQLFNTTLTTTDSQYVLNQLTSINLAMNRDTIALQWIQRLEQMSLPFSDAIAADYLYNKGTWAYHTFQPKTAESYLRKALTLYEKLYGERHLKTAQCLTQLGHLFYEFSNYPDSIFSYIPRAYDIFQANPILKKHSGYAELGMAQTNNLKRNTEIGWYHSENTISLLSKTPFIDSITLARATTFKGQILKKIGTRVQDKPTKNRIYEESTKYRKQALTLIKEDHPRYQEMLSNYLILLAYDQDSVRFFKNLTTLRKNVQQQGNYYAYEERLLGYYYYGNNEKTIKYYTKFLNKYALDSLVGHRLKTEAFYSLITAFGDTTSIESNSQEAIRYANAWITGNHDLGLDKQSTNNSNELSTAYNAMYAFIPLDLIANAYWKKYLKHHNLADLEKTISLYKRADSLLFNTVNVLENDVMINFQKAIGNYLYPTALQAIYEQYTKTKELTNLEDAFHFSERMKSGILFRDMNLLNNSDTIAILKTELEKLKGASSVHQLTDYATTDKIAYLNRQLDKLIQSQKTESKEPTPSLAATRQQLLPNQAIIQYNLDPTQHVLHALYFSRDTVQFYQYESKDLKNQLEQYQKQITDYNNSVKNKAAFSELSYALYQILLQAFEKDLYKRNDWIIIPDRSLHQIPFESLLTTEEFTDYKSAPYLITQPNLTISYAPSLKLFQLNAAKEEVAATDKLLYFTYGKGIDEIPCAAAETDSLQVIFGEQAHIYTDQNCTKEQFLSAWRQDYGILQLSLHAQGNIDDLFNNKIWFQPNKKDALYGFELTGTQTDIKLVILSACETNVGNTDLGEGVYSMARYFFQSNTKVIVASLWKIEDCPNAEIMRLFYHQLKRGQQPKQALSEAKRLFLQQSSDNLLAHPGLWSGLVCLD